MKKAQMGDWFIVFLLSKKLDSVLFKEFIVRLAVDAPMRFFKALRFCPSLGPVDAVIHTLYS